MNSNRPSLFNETFDFLIGIAEFNQDHPHAFEKMKKKTISGYLDSKKPILQDRECSVAYLDNGTLVKITDDTTIEDFGASPKLVVSCLGT